MQLPHLSTVKMLAQYFWFIFYSFNSFQNIVYVLDNEIKLYNGPFENDTRSLEYGSHRQHIVMMTFRRRADEYVCTSVHNQMFGYHAAVPVHNVCNPIVRSLSRSSLGPAANNQMRVCAGRSWFDWQLRNNPVRPKLFAFASDPLQLLLHFAGRALDVPCRMHTNRQCIYNTRCENIVQWSVAGRQALLPLGTRSNTIIVKCIRLSPPWCVCVWFDVWAHSRWRLCVCRAQTTNLGGCVWFIRCRVPDTFECVHNIIAQRDNGVANAAAGIAMYSLTPPRAGAASQRTNGGPAWCPCVPGFVNDYANIQNGERARWHDGRQECVCARRVRDADTIRRVKCVSSAPLETANRMCVSVCVCFDLNHS